MGHLIISQFGDTKSVAMPDAMIQAMDTVLIESFTAGRGVALDGIRSTAADTAGSSTDGEAVTTMWLAPTTALTFEYVRGSDDTKTADHIRTMRRTLSESGRIIVR